MKFSIPLLCLDYKISLDTLRQYLNEETLKRLSVVDGTVRVDFEQVINISIAEGDTPDGLAKTCRMEARGA